MHEYKLSIERRPRHVYASVRGANTPETILRYMREIREACARLGEVNVLVVVDLTGPGVSMLDLYKVMTTGSDEAIGSGLRVAYVELNPERSDANMFMAEDVAMTRGISVRTFRDVGLAEAWLLGP